MTRLAAHETLRVPRVWMSYVIEVAIALFAFFSAGIFFAHAIEAYHAQ